MLKSIRIQNFKSYKDATFELSPFTVLIGANASGKSNAIEALRFMSILAQGQKLSSLPYSTFNKEGGIRGKISNLMYQDSSECSFLCNFDDCDYDNLELTLSLLDEELHISNESVSSSKRKIPLYKIKERSGGVYASDVVVSYDNFTRGSKKNLINCSDQMTIFSQLTTSAPFQEKYEKSKEIIPNVCKTIEKTLDSFIFLDPVPAKMRSYCARDRALTENGGNLSGVIYNLTRNPAAYTREERKKNKKDILDFIKNLPEQNFTGLFSIKEPRGESIVSLKESFGGEGKEYDASLLSDGTLRVLAIAVALLSSPEYSTVVIEELDNGIHPSRAKTLLSKINEVAQKRHLKILITTHNPTLLDALPDEIVSDCVFCYRDPVDGSSKLRKISDLPNYFDLLVQGSLGDLLVSNRINDFVKKNLANNGKSESAYSWLVKLKSEIKG